MSKNVASEVVVAGKMGTKDKRKILKIISYMTATNENAARPVEPNKLLITEGVYNSITRNSRNPLDIIIERGSLRGAILY